MCYVDFNGINAASVDENTKGSGCVRCLHRNEINP